MVSISAPALAALRLLADRRVSPDDVPLPAAVVGEVRSIMTTLLSHLLGRPLRVRAALSRGGRRIRRT